MHAEGRITRWFVWGLAGLLSGGLLGAGCAEDKDEPNIEEVVGTVESIDLAKKRVMVRTYREKRETYETFPVYVTDETEILINGALADMEDVKVGERAEGRIRIEREPTGTRFVALSVRLERSEVLTAPGANAGQSSAGDPTGESATGTGTNGAAEETETPPE